MEREFTPPANQPEAAAPPMAPGPERAKKPSKKETPAPEKAAKKPEAAETPPETPKKQKLGARVINLIFGRPAQPEAPAPPVAVPEAAASAEITEPLERAGRMRRLARKVIGHVLGEAEAEPARARAESPGGEPLDTEPLAEAAEDLRDATDNLDDTIREAEETLVYERPRQTPESPASSPDFGGTFHIAERIAQQVDKLEAKANASSAVSLAALGLGVVAVLLAGHKYSARKRVEKKQSTMQKAHRALEKEVKMQRQEFAALQKEQAAQMDREHRRDYYERLSEFTHQQAASAREVNRELQQTIETVVPTLEPLPPVERPRPVRVPEVAEHTTLPEPLKRVETADTVERGGQQPGNAGTGFFGGGMTAWGGRIQQAMGAVGLAKQPTKDQQTAELQRQARLASNAWLYTIGFVISVVALVLSIVFA